MDMTQIGTLIRTLRRSKGLTQLTPAEQLHISDKTVSKWKRVKGAPDISLLPQIAHALQRITQDTPRS